MTAFERARQLSGGDQLAAGSALVLIGGSLAPWVKFTAGDGVRGDYISGIEFNAGALTLLIGALVIFLLVRRATAERGVDSGAIAALGLLAGALIAVTGIRYHQHSFSVDWGLWVTAVGALALLISGLVGVGGETEAPPPPD